MGYLVVLTAGLASSQVALAQDSERFRYYPDLVFGPVDLPQGDHWINERDPIVAVPLVPRAIFRSERAIIADGMELAPADTLFETMTSAIPIVCSQTRGLGDALLKERKVCLADRNRDGQLESAWAFETGAALWDFNKRIPEETVQVSPPPLLPYTITDYSVFPKFTIWSHHTALRRRPRDGSAPYWEAFYSAQIRSSAGYGNIYTVNQSSVPGTVFEFAGFRFLVLEIDGEHVKGRYLSGFSPVSWRDAVQITTSFY